MLLVTLLHISDLHFGDYNSTTGDAVEPKLTGLAKAFDGLLGHNITSLKRTLKFWRQLRPEKPVLVVTGDLTTVGKFEQFRMADGYLGARIDLSSIIPHLLPFGLNVPDWKDRGIPGNHDHWPGSCEAPNFMFGPPPKDIYDNFLGEYPKIYSITLDTGHVLKFLMIDTDADVGNKNPNRFFARGEFTSQLDAIERDSRLGDSENEIRVLCLHHSPAHIGFTLGIDDRSRGALNDFIVKQNVAVLLTGHKHTPPLVQPFPATHLGISRNYLEARCGSTSQRSTLSYSTSTFTGGRPRRPDQLPNVLLVHRLYLKDKEIFWHTECFFELPTGFQELSSITSPAIKALSIAGPFKVFP